MKIKSFLTLILIVVCLFRCSTPEKNYVILEETPTETSNKAQLKYSVLYTDSIYSENKLKEVLENIYATAKTKDVFENFNAPTVVAIYLYTSKEAAEEKSDWIAMLAKGPKDEKPRLSFNSFKINALQGLTDNTKSSDEISYEKLVAYLSERGLELCSFRNILRDNELQAIREADKKYPDFGDNHMTYSDSIIKAQNQELISKYNLADSIFLRVIVFGASYCK